MSQQQENISRGDDLPMSISETNRAGDLHTNEEAVHPGEGTIQSNHDEAAGTDRAGTAERKEYGDVELNKGLESQAMDRES